MPHVDVRVAKKLSAQDKDKLQLKIGNSMSLLPEKTISNTMIVITDGCSIYKNGSPLGGAFIDVRLYKASPEESKKAFSEKLFEILESELEIPPDKTQINFIELPNWASGGAYR